MSDATMGMSLSDGAQSVAAEFVAARRDARVLLEYPGERPASLARAYAIQDAALAIDGRAVEGWKVGRINSPHDVELGSNRLAGPIFADGMIHAATEESQDVPVFAGGFGAAEAEILMHVAAGWNGQLPLDDAETRAILDDVRLGIEAASSPYPGINADGPCVTISDYGNNLGSIVGAPLIGWRELDICAIKVRTLIDGELVGEATAATMLDGPYGAVRFLLTNLISRGIAADGGLWVSTGAITGVHPVHPGQHVRAEFGEHGAVQCRIVAAKPR